MAYEIQGRMIALPVYVREADSWAAQFMVSARKAQAIVDPTGLEVAQPLPGRAIVNLAFVRYIDSDLDTYNELAVAFLVRPDSAVRGSARDKMREFVRGEIGVYIHELPVTQTFTLEAGRRIWGYPKILADIEITEERGRVTCKLDHEGAHVLTLSLKEGGPIKLPQRELPTYSNLDGVLRRTLWDQQAEQRARLGGAKLELGSHPIADELRTLGLPKRALMTSTMRGMKATFFAAEEV
ncbi:MAG: acetoacetate decarboxylase family protein [Actinomycetota bacterium]